jgi:hypothetical protein
MLTAEVAEQSNGSSTHANDTHKDALKPSCQDLSPFRHLVPFASDERYTYLNASFAPPSNFIIHEAITKYASVALYDPSPESK